MVHTQKKLKVRKVKLGRQRLWGQATYPLQIDPRATGKKELEIYLHEMIHYLYPKLTEGQVVRSSILMTNTLWHEGYRKVDNSNDTPMQDGTL